MRKNYYFWLLTISFLFLAIFYFSSCKKDLFQQSNNETSLNNANATGNSLHMNFDLVHGDQYMIVKINDTLSVRWIPNWSKIMNVKKDTSFFNYIQVKPALFNPKTGKQYVNKNYLTFSTTRYLMATKNNYGKISFWWTDFVQESSLLNKKMVNTRVNLKHFTGNLIVKSLDHKAFKYYKYENGIEVQSPTSSTQNIKTNSWEQQCRDIYNCTFYCSCEGDGATDTYEYQTINPDYCYTPPPPSSQCDQPYEEWFLIDSYTEQQCTQVWVPDPGMPPGEGDDPQYDPIVNDPCDAIKEFAKTGVNQLNDNNSVNTAITQTRQYASQGYESAFTLTNVRGVITASSPVRTQHIGDPYSTTNINQYTVGTGHGHDTSSFPQPSPFDIYSTGELAMGSVGNVGLDYILSPTAEYVLFLRDRAVFNNFLTQYPESNLQKVNGEYTGDLDTSKTLGREVNAVTFRATVTYLSQHVADVNNPTNAELTAAEIAGNEAGTLYLLANYNTGFVLLKRDLTTNEFVPLHVNQTIVNGQSFYKSEPCN